jgi:glycosyltransferase involved in cell wall biosynthesis
MTEGGQIIRLFVDAHSFDKEHQGTRAYIERLYRELSAHAPQIELYFGARDVGNLHESLKSIPNCHFIKYFSGSSIFRLLFEFPYIIRKYRIDIAHYQYISPFLKNCKTIVTTHDILFKDFPNEFSFLYRLSRNYFFKRSIRHADIKTTVSSYSKNAIAHQYKIKLQHLNVIANGVDEKFFKPYIKRDSEKYIRDRYQVSNYILYVSRVEPRKNHALLLKAFVDLKLNERGFGLVLLGHTSITSVKFSELYKQLPPEIKKSILISDQVKDEDLEQFYKGAKIFVFPSKAEGFGLPPIEAGAYRVPVLCSNATAMADYNFFEPHRFDPEKKDQLEKKLLEIILNPPSTDKLAAIAFEIQKLYSMKGPAVKLKQLIEVALKFA